MNEKDNPFHKKGLNKKDFNTIDKITPNKIIETEMCVLGTILMKPDTYFSIAEQLSPETFTDDKNRIIYSAIVDMIDQNAPLDLVTLSLYLSKNKTLELIGGDSFIAQLSPLVPGPTHIEYYAKILSNNFTERQIKIKVNDLHNYSSGEVVKKEIVMEKIDEVLKVLSDNKSNIDSDSIFDELLISIEENKKSLKEGNSVGIPLPWDKITEMTMGMQAGQTWVLGGPTSSGKSALAIQVIHETIKVGKKVALFSLEMTKTDVLSRLIALDLKVNSMDIKKGEHEVSKIESFREKYRDNLFIFDIEKDNINDIVLNIKSLSMVKGVDLFVIDYIQQINTNLNLKEHEKISMYASKLQKVAQQIKKPIFTLSQLSNSALEETGSENAGFKGSGDIANKSNVAIKIIPGIENRDHRTEMLGEGGSVPMKLYLFKNRDGRAGMAYTLFSGKDGLFTQIDRERYEREIKNLKAEKTNQFVKGYANTDDDDNGFF